MRGRNLRGLLVLVLILSLVIMLTTVTKVVSWRPYEFNIVFDDVTETYQLYIENNMDTPLTVTHIIIADGSWAAKEGPIVIQTAIYCSLDGLNYTPGTKVVIRFKYHSRYMYNVV